MAKIEVVNGYGWTTFHVRGETCREDIASAIHAFFPKLVFPDVIWDLSEASIASMSRTDFEEIASAAKTYEELRGHAKTVFVASTPETFALVCMYTGLAAMTELDVDYSAFTALEHAERWLVCNRAHRCASPGAGADLHHCGEKACREVRLFQAARKINVAEPVALHAGRD
ncbi:MAG: hypothetical protein QM715_04090 [Nibricoccus sp.]